MNGSSVDAAAEGGFNGATKKVMASGNGERSPLGL